MIENNLTPKEDQKIRVRKYKLNEKLFVKKKKYSNVSNKVAGGFVSVCCEPKQRRQLEAIAKNESKPFAECIRLALQLFIESYLSSNNLPEVKDQSMVKKGVGRKRKYELKEIEI